MLDKAPAVELVTEVLIERVRVWTVVAAGDLDAYASMRPGELLCCADEQATNALLAIVRSDDEARDPPERAVYVKQWDAMTRDDTHKVLIQLGYEDGGVGRSREIHDALLNLRDRRRVTESSQQFANCRSIVTLGVANDRRNFSGLVVSARTHGPITGLTRWAAFIARHSIDRF
jgi:hypothetical protein